VQQAIPGKNDLLDRMAATKLAANPFRMTRICDKLARDRVQKLAHAIQMREQVGREMRHAK